MLCLRDAKGTDRYTIVRVAQYGLFTQRPGATEHHVPVAGQDGYQDSAAASNLEQGNGS